MEMEMETAVMETVVTETVVTETMRNDENGGNGEGCGR
jgi:hypothetical protein